MYHLKSGKEYIWNFSNPPYIKSEDDISIAKFGGRLKGKELYREYLSKKYGKKKMLFSGIHFNFSFTEQYLKEAFINSESRDFRTFKDNLYIELAQKTVGYGWLIVYMTAASPLMDGSFLDYEKIGQDVLSPYASARCSEIGYWNDFVPILDYTNLNAYTDSIQEYVDSGQLKTATELYYPVRLKPKGENSLDNLKKSGVNHIELRNIDLNPLSDIGMMKEDISFLHLLMIYLNVLQTKELEDFEQITAVKNVKKAALFDDRKIEIETGWDERVNIREAALKVVEDMENLFDLIGNDKAKVILTYQKNKIIHRKERYAIKIMNTFEGRYVAQGMKMAETYGRKVSEQRSQ